ncbi:universal stress protein [Bacillus suaedaesalsae]|uniref:Universal stress protein n=1 Tax=Bacillus suaedaesalsae TaxID=2810349 RepID=A0ABS2DDS6_9BACI|nr:universal stress protein [Bacillus suaedaesalsae]MBM6616609.1 universal stress protein [Bacillus suaedaesalsae]
MLNNPSKILVAYDGLELSNKALQYAIKLVEHDKNAELEVVTVMAYSAIVGSYEAYSLMEMRTVAEAAAKARINEAREVLKTLPNPTGTKVLEGDPAVQIIKYAEELEFDVIVMGSRGLGKIREFFLGSVSHNVVQMAKCPVFIVKTRGA